MTTISEILAGRAQRLAAATDDGERLRLMRVEIAETEADLERAGRERQAYAVAVLTGEAEAIAARRALDGDIERLEIRLVDLRGGLAETEARRRAAAVAEDAAAQAERRRRTASARARLAEQARDIEVQAQRLGEAMRECRTAMLELAAASGNPQIKRNADGFPEMLRNTLARHFKINQDGAIRTDNSLLNLVAEWVGEMSQRRLGQIVADLLDDLAPVFTAREDAEACRERLKARKMQTVVVALADHLWLTLPVTSVFRSEAEARSAIASVMTFRMERHQAVPYLGAWLVLRPELAAALAPESAEAA